MSNKTGATWPEAMAAVKTHLEGLDPDQRVEAIYDIQECHGFCEHCGQRMTPVLSGRMVCHCRNDE